ncbi:MAG TPA: BTAD domain-containing putative transcriptional regulator [Candidatus Limnocylindrales bacterium]|nr:BTAD domain-containing putative transcriptional regulator [Candidatus Limnocylindrales bacterium]
MSDIKDAYPLILNKVASPHYATPTLRRARLIDWLNQASGCRAAVIAADAGYGKTTLLWQWEREVDFPCYWYKLDRNDRDWTFHISYLIQSIAKRHKDFGRRAHSMLQQLGGPGSSRPGVAAYLLAEMHERLTEPCTFIIDDWQYVNAVTEVRGLWNQILRDAPPTCRFVFASRVKPRLQFARFKTHSGYAELRTDALRFSESEIEELFRDIYNDPLDPTDVAELERRTEGWAASLQLVEVSLRERPSAEERSEFIQSITATSDSDLFDFLAEEVLDQQPEETRNFLLTTSILQQITPEVAERLAGVHDGRRELTELEHRGLFTNRLDDERYRYHNLFRDFLERRLTAERSEAEVVGLHIHAASYFETTEQWPEAIHHYLRAGLQRQAARLIAKYGEDVVSSGRLGLVDEWLQQLPHEMVKQNARLSLLYGEACGIRGDWELALEALNRARQYFSRKGDRRLEALACLKLSSVYSNYGDTERAAEVAEAGVAIVPPDAVGTRLRLEGNVAITRTWLTGPLEAVVRECQRIAVEATARGFEHFAAVGHHNAGEMQLRMGQIDKAVVNLERSARFWAETPTSPFAHNEELTFALVVARQKDRAAAVATDAIRRTSPWPRPTAHALYGWASVLASEGRLRESAGALRMATSRPSVLGAANAPLFARLMESLYLDGQPSNEILDAAASMESGPTVDLRYSAEIAPARSIAKHLATACSGQCLERLSEMADAESVGAKLVASVGRVKIGALALEHRASRPKRDAWLALSQAMSDGYLEAIRWWVRRYASHAEVALTLPSGADTLADLLAWDPDGWRTELVRLLPITSGRARAVLLKALTRYANRETVIAFGEIPGPDVADARRQLQQTYAARVYLRTFGGISLRRGAWHGPPISIDKRRVRALLAVLGAHAHTTLTRDMAVDILWPEADGDSAINNLNQTVFQLRRYLDPSYRQGESPEYIISSADQVTFAPGLVHTDLQEFRRQCDRLTDVSWQQRQDAATKAIALVRGEFLADLRYETWASRLQVAVHNEVRARLLPIATQSHASFDSQVAMNAAASLVSIDPFDEAATLALAECLSRSGQRRAARDLLVRFAEQVRAEFDEDLPQAISDGVERLRRSSQI